MRLFVSSTVYDLLDVRAVIAEVLPILGISPVMSDDKLSDFRVEQSQSSIETCLVNVRECDEAMFVLDQRYGPRLGKYGFDDISATHLEYRAAVTSGLPLHFFVRDRLEAEYSIWKRNGRSDSVELAWVGKRDHGLFELLEEHASLREGQNNWYTTFSNAVDLRRALEQRLGPRNLPKVLRETVQNNLFPLFRLDVAAEFVSVNGQNLSVKAHLTNVGGAPAFDVIARWENHGDEIRHQVVPPGVGVKLPVLMIPVMQSTEIRNEFSFEYDTAIGVRVIQRYDAGARAVGAGGILHGGELLEQRYVRSDGPSFQIEE